MPARLPLNLLALAALAAVAAALTLADPPIARPGAARIVEAADAEVAALPRIDCFSSVLHASVAGVLGGQDPRPPPGQQAQADLFGPCASLTHARQVDIALAFLACQADFLGEAALPACAAGAAGRLAAGPSASKAADHSACIAALTPNHYNTFQGFFRSATSMCLHYAHRDWAANSQALLSRLLAGSAAASASLASLSSRLEAVRGDVYEVHAVATAGKAAAQAGEAAAERAAALTSGLAAELAAGVAAVKDKGEAAAAAAAAAARSTADAAAASTRHLQTLKELGDAVKAGAAANQEAVAESSAAFGRAVYASAAAVASATAALAGYEAQLAAVDAKMGSLFPILWQITKYQGGAEALLRRVLGAVGGGRGGRWGGAWFGVGSAAAIAASAAATHTRAASLPLVLGLAGLVALERCGAAVEPALAVAASMGRWGGGLGGWVLLAADTAAAGLAGGAARPFAALVAATLLLWFWRPMATGNGPRARAHAAQTLIATLTADVARLKALLPAQLLGGRRRRRRRGGGDADTDADVAGSSGVTRRSSRRTAAPPTPVAPPPPVGRTLRPRSVRA